MGIFSFFLGRIPNITYAITVCDEYKELEKLIEHLFKHIKSTDQIVVLQDVTNSNQRVTEVLKSYIGKIIHVEGKLENNFSDFKNKLLEHATADYLFQIDADEIPSISLLNNIGSYLKKYKKYDCFSIPRINRVDGITDEYLRQWNWSQNKENYINFPDLQMRLFKLDSKKIHWVNKVHETLVGYNRLRILPTEDYSFCLIHEKSLKKQLQQNTFYDNI